ncbi:trehalose-phosphatase [bacterium]|nr:trehalose-phosphatase [bacterium]
MSSKTWEEFNQRLAKTHLVRLLLDYDGTLAPFAPSPDVIQQDPALIALMSRLASQGNYLLAVVSGRSLPHLQELLPFGGLLLAGTYGLEIQLPDGTVTAAVVYDQVRPMMERVKPVWQQLLDGQHGFFLEDKGWALALHARFATNEDALQVLGHAQKEVEALSPGPAYAVERRPRFLEIYPIEASKSRSIQLILTKYTPPGALPVFAGDDYHDEEAFSTVQSSGGYCIRIAPEEIHTRAQFRLDNPVQVRDWLAGLLNH